MQSSKLSVRHESVNPRLWHKPAHWLAFPALMCMTAFAAPAFAQSADASVVFFSTTESAGIGGSIVYQAWNAFSSAAQADGLSFLDANTDTFTAGAAPAWVAQGALSDPDTPLASYIGVDTKVIVLLSVFGSIDSSRMTELQSIMQSSPGVTVVAFLDGCCAASQNLTPFLSGVNAIRPSGWPELALGGKKSGNYTAYLNQGSIHADTFADNLPALLAQTYAPIDRSPADYALYTQTAAGTTPAPELTSNVAGLFIPQQASNNGQGACVFLAGDASGFDPNVFKASTGQYTAIASDFIAAATGPDGACSRPVAGQPSLSPVFSGPSNLTIGIPAAITLTITNDADAVASTDGALTVTWPAGLTLQSLPSSATVTAIDGTTSTVGLPCAPADGGKSVVCATLPGLDPGDSVVLTFQIIPTGAITSGAMTAQVSGITGEADAQPDVEDAPHLTATLNLSVVPLTVATVTPSVPTLTVLALVLLVVGGTTFRIRRQCAGRHMGWLI